MHSGADFDDASSSIDFFLGLSDNVLKGANISTPRHKVEHMLNVTAVEDDNEAIYIDNGRLRLVWVVCTDVCLKYLRN